MKREWPRTVRAHTVADLLAALDGVDPDVPVIVSAEAVVDADGTRDIFSDGLAYVRVGRRSVSLRSW